jgi:hypothetical protein
MASARSDSEKDFDAALTRVKDARAQLLAAETDNERSRWRAELHQAVAAFEQAALLMGRESPRPSRTRSVCSVSLGRSFTNAWPQDHAERRARGGSAICLIRQSGSVSD